MQIAETVLEILGDHWRAVCFESVRRGTRFGIPDTVRRSPEGRSWVIRLT
jgi:hypothetical protein